MIHTFFFTTICKIYSNVSNMHAFLQCMILTNLHLNLRCHKHHCPTAQASSSSTISTPLRRLHPPQLPLRSTSHSHQWVFRGVLSKRGFSDSFGMTLRGLVMVAPAYIMTKIHENHSFCKHVSINSGQILLLLSRIWLKEPENPP